MPKDFRTILKNIPENDVANFRKSNKQIKKNEDIETVSYTHLTLPTN